MARLLRIIERRKSAQSKPSADLAASDQCDQNSIDSLRYGCIKVPAVIEFEKELVNGSGTKRVDTAKLHFNVLVTIIGDISSADRLPSWIDEAELDEWLSDLSQLIDIKSTESSEFIIDWLQRRCSVIEYYVIEHGDDFGADHNLHISDEDLQSNKSKKTNFFGMNEKSIKNSLTAARDRLRLLKAEIDATKQGTSKK